MVDRRPDPWGPSPATPPSPGPPPGAWAPAAAPPPAARPPARHRPRRNGCGTSLAFLLVIVVVIGAIVGAAVVAVRWRQANDPAHQRAERIDDLRSVCDGQGIADVPAYQRGATGALGARSALEDRGPDDDDVEDVGVVAFPLVPGGAGDPEAVLDAQLMACTASTATTTEPCAFVEPGRGPSFGGGNVTADWPTLTTTELRIVDVHSGKVLQATTFETPSECPRSLQVDDDGSYDARLPLDEIAEQTEAQVALFHQG